MTPYKKAEVEDLFMDLMCDLLATERPYTTINRAQVERLYLTVQTLSNETHPSQTKDDDP
jgi:hypothetical protein